MSKRTFRLISFFIAITLFAGCGAFVSPEKMYTLQDDVSKLKREVEDIRTDKERREKVRREMGISGQTDISDSELDLRKELAAIKADMEELRGEISTFQGFIDETRYRMREDQLATKEKMRLNENRILALEGRHGITSATKGLIPPSPPTGVDKKVLPSAPSPPLRKKEPVFTSEREIPAGGMSRYDTPEDLYDHALGLIKNGEFGKGRKALEEFAATYQEHRLMPNVFYWRGETFYAEKDYESAAITFQEVIDRYPGSPKASDALYKQGFCFLNLKDPVSAKAAFKLLLSKYPTSIAAGKAKTKLKELGEKGGG